MEIKRDKFDIGIGRFFLALEKSLNSRPELRANHGELKSQILKDTKHFMEEISDTEVLEFLARK